MNTGILEHGCTLRFFVNSSSYNAIDCAAAYRTPRAITNHGEFFFWRVAIDTIRRRMQNEIAGVLSHCGRVASR